MAMSQHWWVGADGNDRSTDVVGDSGLLQKEVTSGYTCRVALAEDQGRCTDGSRRESGALQN